MPLKFKSFYSSLHRVQFISVSCWTPKPTKVLYYGRMTLMNGISFQFEISRLFDMDILLLDIVMLILIYIHNSYMLICTTLYQPLCMYPYIYFCDGQKSAPISTFRFLNTTIVFPPAARKAERTEDNVTNMWTCEPGNQCLQSAAIFRFAFKKLLF